MQPIVFYGAEIWDLESSSSVIDNVHLFDLKHLGVDRRTPNDLVYGEVGRFPIQINACVRCIRYWLKLMRFSYVWDNQGVGCFDAFIREFRQRLIDIRWQAWDDHVNTSDRFSLYRQFKTLACVEPI